MSGKCKNEETIASTTGSENNNGTNNTAAAAAAVFAPLPVASNNVAAAPLTDKEEISLNIKNLFSSVDVAASLTSLRELVWKFDGNEKARDNQKTAFCRGAHLAIVQAMRKNLDSPEIQRDGLDALFSIGCCYWDNTSSSKEGIVAVGALDCCVEALQRHLNESLVQQAGLALITKFFDSPNLRKKVVDEGGLEAVKNAMESHKDDAKVQVRGVEALKVLLGQGFSWAKAATDVGAIELVVLAMNGRPENVDLQVQGCNFFSRLSKAGDSYRTKIIQGKGLVAIVEAQRIHIDNLEVKTATKDAYNAISA